jgi:hypothetical protein
MMTEAQAAEMIALLTRLANKLAPKKKATPWTAEEAAELGRSTVELSRLRNLGAPSEGGPFPESTTTPEQFWGTVKRKPKRS